MKHQAKKQTRNQHMPVVIVCILILVLAVMGLGMHFIKKYIPTKERMNLTEYYGQPGDGEMAVVLGTEIMEERALMSGDQIYLPLDMVNTYLNQRYYWDSADQQVLYATPSELQYYPAAESGEGDVWLKDEMCIRDRYMAFRKDVTVAIFSLEMSKEQLVNRLLAMESHVDSQNMRTGNLKDEDWTKLVEGADIIGRSNLIIDDTPGISIAEMRSKCRKYKLEHNLGIIMIDYLQLMSGSGKSDSRQQEISDISRSLKALARELSVPVIALSQLSRAVEQRPDHRPMLSDLRESGAIEQDADVVMFLYRDDYYHKDTEKKDIAEVIIAKQRNGPIGTIELVWLPRYTQFVNMKK